jgi:hypothetical protein
VTAIQPPLFGPPDPEPPPAQPRVTWARYRPLERHGCDRCRARLVELGIARAPFPRPARWARTTTTGGTTYLCQPCAADLRKQERGPR